MSETFYCASCSKYRPMDMMGVRKPTRGPICTTCVKIIKQVTAKPAVSKPRKAQTLERLVVVE